MRRIGASIAVAVLVVAIGTGGTANASDPAGATLSDEVIQAAAAERDVYGLQTDRAYVTWLLTSGADVGTSSVGLPLTASEVTALDLLGRAAAADRADRDIRPAALSQLGFAGMFQDQVHGGRIVVLFTNVSSDGRAAVKRAAGALDVVVEDGARSTFAELSVAADRALVERTTLLPGVEILGVGIDEADNRLDLGVLADSLDRASVDVGAVSEQLGVDVRFQATEPEVNQACDNSGRSFCFDRMRAGTLVHNANWDGATCTMGFHVQLRTNTANKGFVLSGHCSYPGGSTQWYMDSWGGPLGNGWIGAVQKNLYKDLGQDFMVVAMPRDQVSRTIYDTSRSVAGSGNPVQGETIYISPGMTDEDLNTGIDSGVVNAATYSYVSDDGFIIHAADADNFATRSGDSGSPIYRAYGGGAIAVGIHSTASGKFARMQAALNDAGWSVH